jgi:hypothetical protein
MTSDLSQGERYGIRISIKDQSVRRFAQDDGFVGVLTENIPNEGVLADWGANSFGTERAVAQNGARSRRTEWF